MKKYLKNIDRQIEFNRGKNIFLSEHGMSLTFIDETIRAISSMDEADIDFENVLLDYATDKAIEEFCRMNQYYTFNSQAKRELRDIYSALFLSIRSNESTIGEIEIESLPKIERMVAKGKSICREIIC